MRALRRDTDLYTRLPAGDDPLMLMTLSQGKGCCFQEFMSAYRLHSGGMWSSQPRLRREYKQLLFYYSIPCLIGSDLAGMVGEQTRRGEANLARTIGSGSVLGALVEFLRLSARNDLIPKRRIPPLVYRSLRYAIGRSRSKLGTLVRNALHHPTPDCQ